MTVRLTPSPPNEDAYGAAIARAKKRWGDELNTNKLNVTFSRFVLHNCTISSHSWRVKIDDYGTIRYGYVSISTGKQPVLILLRSRKHISSSFILDDKVKFLGARRANDRHGKWHTFPYE